MYDYTMDYYKTIDYIHDCKTWIEIKDSHGLCWFMNMFIDNKIPCPSYPNHMGAYRHENNRLLNKLRNINTANILTISSRPTIINPNVIERGFIEIYVPNEDVEDICKQLLTHDVIILLTTADKNCQDTISTEYAIDIHSTTEQKEVTSFAMHNVEGLSDNWGPQEDKKNAHSPYDIPLVVEYINNQWHVCKYISIYTAVENFTRFFNDSYGILPNLIPGIKDNMCQLYIIDVHWNKNNNNAIDIMEAIALEESCDITNVTLINDAD